MKKICKSHKQGLSKSWKLSDCHSQHRNYCHKAILWIHGCVLSSWHYSTSSYFSWRKSTDYDICWKSEREFWTPSY